MKSISANTKNKFFVMDIETNTAWAFKDGEYIPACAWMYLGCLVDDDENAIFFHDWDEYREILSELPEGSVIFVHNLAYEFEYLTRNDFRFVDLIAVDAHHPITATDIDYKIKYRCSYKLLDKSVKELGKELGVDKLDYNYTTIRAREDLTADDYEYNKRDCVVVVRAIKRELEIYETLDNLPLTKTGKVRKLLRDNDGGELASRASRAFTDEPLYDMLECAFVGGFTYGNPAYFSVIVDNVKSFDRKSAYPATMLKERFPQKFSRIFEGDEAERVYSRMVCGQNFVAEFYIEKMVAFDSRLCVISNYKTRGSGNRILYNGKIYSASDVRITCDSVSWGVYQKIYSLKGVRCERIAVATSMRRLPAPLLRTIAELAYEKERIGHLKKTTDESADNYGEISRAYQRVKEMLNSIYGANVQRLRNFDYTVNERGEWCCEVEPYKKPRGIIRAFAWGVWVTAYSRKALIDEILNIGLDDFVYCDTDSIKTRGDVKITEYYTEEDKEYLSDLLGEHFEAVKKFGEFEFEDISEKFQHYGAKKYFVIKNGVFKYTVAGLPKGKGVKDCPRCFDDVYAGRCYKNVKLARVLVDNTYKGELFEKVGDDFRAWRGDVLGRGGVALKETDYTLNVTHLDAWYIKEFGIECASFVENVEIFDNIDRTKYLIERLIV